MGYTKQPGSWILELKAVPQKDWLKDGRMHPETGMKSEASMVWKRVRMVVKPGLTALRILLGPGTVVKYNFVRTSVHLSLLFSLGRLPVVITFGVNLPYNSSSKAMTQTIVTRWLNGSLV